MGRAPYHKEENWIVSGQNLIVLGFVIFGDKIWSSGWTLELTIATIEKRGFDECSSIEERNFENSSIEERILRSILQTDVKL